MRIKTDSLIIKVIKDKPDLLILLHTAPEEVHLGVYNLLIYYYEYL